MRLRLLIASGLALVVIADVTTIATWPYQVGGHPQDQTVVPAPTTSTASHAPAAPPTPPGHLLLDVYRDPIALQRGASVHTTYAMSVAGTDVHRAPTQLVPSAQTSPALHRIVLEVTGGLRTATGCGVAGCTATSYESVGIALALPSRSGVHVLTSGGYDTDPTFAPDGRRIAYLAHVQLAGQVTDEVIVMSPTGKLVKAFPPAHDFMYRSPRWSPDGRALAVVRRPVGGGPSLCSVLLLPLRIGRPRVISRTCFTKLTWAPNGQSLIGIGYVGPLGAGPAFRARSSADLTGFDLWRLGLDGTLTRITRFGTRPARSARVCNQEPQRAVILDDVVSLDSRWVAFTFGYDQQVGPHTDVYVARVDGTSLHRVWRTPPPACSRPYWANWHANLLGWS